MADPIRKITLKNGTVRYRFVIDAPPGPDGKRQQIRRTFDTKKQARDDYARIRHERATGSYVAPSKMTVNELLELWLKSAIRDVEEATATNYYATLRPVREFLGHMRIQQLTEEDVEALIDWMATSARQRGGTPGTGLAVSTIQVTVSRLRAALTLGIRRGWLVRNVAQYVRVTREVKNKAAQTRQARRPWDESEVHAFIEGSKDDRLFGAMLLALIAERPAEVCGARWEEDVWLGESEGTIAVGNTRTLVYDRSRPFMERTKVVEKGPKTDAGGRVLPLPSPVFRALKATRVGQLREKLAAGEAYEESGYVIVDELGRPLKTNKLRREAYRLMAQAGVRKVRLYDARHAVLSWMANNGVPDTVVSAWAGHTDLSFTKRVYVHPDPQSLKAGADKLGQLLG
ncbi:tyrosine-type recombinase/integrase [Kitasatospora sp. NPDC005856]|uniref:site-specific integrase n=1 Tax=Kitasatospora sp. NPDC005856 TaxID=3154566 RepID=UPI0033EEF003